MSSARAVAGVKRLLPRKTKIGHTGTLDPLASGLLVLLVGRATRLSRYITGLHKSYTATATLGATSDTLDAEGEISLLPAAPTPTERDIRAAIPAFTGDLHQLPPMASAVKVGGERLYKLHRRGETVERETRPVTVHSLALVSYDPGVPSATFEIECSSGTYVRTLISDLADSLGTGAYLTALRRTSVAHLDLKDAIHPEDLSDSEINNHIIPVSRVASHLPVVEVGPEEGRGVCNGRSLELSEDPAGGGSFRVEQSGELLAVYRFRDGAGRAEAVLCGG